MVLNIGQSGGTWASKKQGVPMQNWGSVAECFNLTQLLGWSPNLLEPGQSFNITVEGTNDTASVNRLFNMGLLLLYNFDQRNAKLVFQAVLLIPMVWCPFGKCCSWSRDRYIPRISNKNIYIYIFKNSSHSGILGVESTNHPSELGCLDQILYHHFFLSSVFSTNKCVPVFHVFSPAVW